MNKAGDLKVWWVPQVPMKAFEVPVKDIKEAAKVLQLLASYDAFQFENRVKPDYSNAGGLNVFNPIYVDEECDGWITWYSENGEDIDDVMRGLNA